MLASVVPTGTSSPLCTIALSTVPNGEPLVQAISACGLADLICCSCAETLTSDGLNCTAAAMVSPAFSGSLSASSNARRPSWPLASVLVIIANFVNPRPR